MHTNIAHNNPKLRKFAGMVMLCVVGVVAYVVSPHAVSQDKTKPASAAAPVSTSASARAIVTKPEWHELAPDVQAALKPLQPNWQSMSPAQKRKWLELSKNYATLATAEQNKLHTRMTEWSSLSSQQRAEARLNFAENRAMTDGLTPEQRKVQWEAYQLLSPEEKRKLADSSQKPPAGTAIAAKPAQPIRQSPPPQFGTAKALAAASASNPTQGRKISIAPPQQVGNAIVPQGLAKQGAPSQVQASDTPAVTSKQ